MDGELQELRLQVAELQAQLDQRPKRRPRPKDTIRYWTEEQLHDFFRVIEHPRDVAIFRILYHRGLRASELGMLQLSDWHRERDRLRFQRLKGSNGGEYHLTSHEVRALKAWLKIRGSDAGALFPSRQSHTQGISRAMIDRLVKRYGKLAGLPPELCHAHALKHSCATHLLNRGESIEDVQDHLGHAAIANTTIYAKYTNQRRQERDRRLRDW